MPGDLHDVTRLNRVATSHTHGDIHTVSGYNVNDESGLGFLNIFAWSGTIYPAVGFQMCFFAVWACVICYITDQHAIHIPASLCDVHSAVGFFLSLLFGFRIGNSLSLNGKALTLIGGVRGACRKMMKAACNYSLKSEDPATLDEVTRLRLSIRRRCDIMWAFMRQHLRESRNGFHPESDMAKVPFGPDTYMDDPCHPLLCERLTEQEIVKYAALTPAARVSTVVSELSRDVHLMSKYYDCTNEYASNVSGFVDAAVGKWSACDKELNEAIPFVYKHALYNLLTAYVLLYPLTQIQNYDDKLTHTEFIVTVALSVLVAGVYFGVMHACGRLCGPFGWDPNDMDLEHIGKQIVAQGNRVTATALGRPCKYVPKPAPAQTAPVDVVPEGSML